MDNDDSDETGRWAAVGAAAEAIGDALQLRAMAGKTPSQRQWDAVFLRVLTKSGGDVDAAVRTADKAVPAWAEERRRERETRRGRAEAGRRRQRSKPWVGRMFAASKKRGRR